MTDPHEADPHKTDPHRAEGLARRLLAGHPERLAHSRAVAARAVFLSRAVPAGCRDTLVAAAWLHDIGYTSALYQTRFHPVDGARHLQQLGWPAEVVAGVAHHSGSRFVAQVGGLRTLVDEFAFVEDELTDALTVADQTVGPGGRPMTVDERVRDMLLRHGPDSPNARAHPWREPYLFAAAERVAARLESSGVVAAEHRILLAGSWPPLRSSATAGTAGAGRPRRA